MQCPRCQQDNPTRQKFCGECGTPLQHSSVELTKDRTRLSLFRERLSPADHEDEPLQSTRRFQRLRSGTLIPKLLGVLIGVALAALVLSLAGQHIEQPHSGGPGEPPGQTNESLTLARLPAVTDIPELKRNKFRN